MPRLFPALPYQKAPSLCQRNSSSCAPCPVSCCLSRPVSRIAPSLVLRHLSYHTVSHIVSHTHSTLATLVPHALSHVCIALSHVLPCLSCHLSFPVSL